MDWGRLPIGCLYWSSDTEGNLVASINKDPNERKRIRYTDHAGQRKTLRLGKANMDLARTVKSHVEKLVAAKIGGTAPPVDTSRWLTTIGDVLYAKLADHELVARRISAQATTLKAFLDQYIDKRADVKRSTAVVYGHTRRCLIGYFGADKPLAEITLADAKDWRRWLGLAVNEKEPGSGGQGLSDNTVRRRCGIARQFFTDAVDAGLIPSNPFAGIKGVAVRANKSRFYYVSRDDAAKVIKACPDAQWKLLFALSRYGGLRCPSEHLALRWGDVDFEGGRVTVRSPKTEHHEGKAERVIPLFPELRPLFQKVLDELLADFDPKAKRLSEQPIITRYRSSNANLRTQLCRIIRKAGLAVWPKLFQNLRSTRETELAEAYPIHVVCEWIGNSQSVAAKHYLQTTDEHFAKAAQNAAQNATLHDGTERNTLEPKREKPDDYQNRRVLVGVSMGDEGLEPPTLSV
jgi:integrase